MHIEFEEYLIPIIAIGCLCVGFVLKKWLPTDDKYIPTVLLILGGISGAILFGFNYEGVVKGMLSGLASVGLHQAFYQFIKDKKADEMTEEDGLLALEESEYLQAEIEEIESEDEDE